MNKKLSSSIFCIILSISIIFISITAYATEENISVLRNETDTNDTITETLKQIMQKSSSNEVIPVTVELKDTIELEQIESLAMINANVTLEQISTMEETSMELDEFENEYFQKEIKKLYDKISFERNILLEDHYSNLNNHFLNDANLDKYKCDSVGIYTPFIRKIELSKDLITLISKRNDIYSIDYAGDDEGYDFASINDTYAIIRGNVCIDNGYTGSGIRVGLVESGHPIFSVMGSDSANITKTNSGTDKEHATKTSGIIKKMAPSCSIYTRASTGLNNAISNCEWLIKNKNVNVINISYGQASGGNYNSYSRDMDQLVKNTRVTIVAASGNGTSSTQYINSLGLAANVITVGAVKSSGTNQAASGAYTFENYSLYKENNPVINKPDICAPGCVKIYSYGESMGTSFSAPHITGTVVQMMSRNSGLTDKPQTLKAAIMASASYNAGTSMSYVNNTKASDKEGAGVVDAGYCYKVARNGRRTHFDASSSSTTFSHNVYCDYINKPFRVACAWEAISNSSNTNITDYDMSIYKDGTLLKTSNAYAHSSSFPNSNYEIIELSPSIISEYGAGYYQVKITRYGNFNGSGQVRIGLAWEQR